MQKLPRYVLCISGADQQLQTLWNTTDLFHGTFIMSMALWGTVFGAIFASYPSDYFGRKNTLVIIGFLYLISALGSGLATNPYMFSFFRFIGGIGVGVSTVAAPTYVSEIAPSSQRGKMVALYQFNIVLGILMASLAKGPIFMVASVLIALTGATLCMPLLNTITSFRTPPKFRGRILGTTSSAAAWGRVVGPMLASAVLPLVGFSGAWFGCGLLISMYLGWSLLVLSQSNHDNINGIS